MGRQLSRHIAGHFVWIAALVTLACQPGPQSAVSQQATTPTADAQRSGAPAGDPLPSWNESASRKALVDFVERTTRQGGPDFVPPAERIAVFDNDGTLWAEQPMYTQLAFALDRIKANAYKTFIVSGGGVEFMRPWVERLWHSARAGSGQPRQGEVRVERWHDRAPATS